MSQSLTTIGTLKPRGLRATPRFRQEFHLDFVVGLIFLVLFGIAVHAFQYRDALGEDDLYRVLVGLLDGAVSGSGIGSSLQYDNTFGFGYLAALYTFLDPAVLRDPDRLMGVINEIGFWSFMIGLEFFWCAVAIRYGSRTATIALIIFALCPAVPELATSGHPEIVMLGFLFAGACLLLLPFSGWRAVLAATGGAILLLAGMTTRVDIVFAFPWLVLSRADTRSPGRFVISCILRSIPPLGAIVVFLVLQKMIAPDQMGSAVGEFFGRWMSLSNVTRGVLYMALGGGLATVAGGALAGPYLAFRSWRGSRDGSRIALEQFLGPAALVAVPFGFFVLNSGPPRHFLFTYAGLSILIAIALTEGLALSRPIVIGAAFLLGAANQVLGEAVRLPLIAANEANSAYRPIWTGYQTTTLVPLGWEWKRHEALVQRRELWQAEGDKLTMPCQPYTLVLSDVTAQLASRLYAGQSPIKAERPAADDILVTLGGPDRTIWHYSKSMRWPEDSVALILKDPTYRQYKLYQDPYTMSAYDRTSIPPDRQAQFGCTGTR